MSQIESSNNINDKLIGMPLTLTKEGLEIPERYQDVQKMTVRTPSTTIDVSSGFSSMVDDDRCKLIQPAHFQTEDDEDKEIKNPDLSPDKVLLKPYGEDAEEFTVEVET